MLFSVITYTFNRLDCQVTDAKILIRNYQFKPVRYLNFDHYVNFDNYI